MSSSILGGSLAAQAQTSLMRSRESSLLQQMKNPQSTDAKIDKSAQEFESMLLSTWLQQAEQSMGTAPGGDNDEDAGAREQMMGLGVQSLANAMAASGGIGIGKMISKALHASAAKTEGSEAVAATAPAEGAKIAK